MQTGKLTADNRDLSSTARSSWEGWLSNDCYQIPESEVWLIRKRNIDRDRGKQKHLQILVKRDDWAANRNRSPECSSDVCQPIHPGHFWGSHEDTPGHGVLIAAPVAWYVEHYERYPNEGMWRSSWCLAKRYLIVREVVVYCMSSPGICEQFRIASWTSTVLLPDNHIQHRFWRQRTLWSTVANFLYRLKLICRWSCRKTTGTI